LQHLLGPGSDAQVVGQIDPADYTGGIEQELRGARDVVTVDAGSFVQQVVAANRFGVGVREKRKGIAGFAAQVLRLAGRIDADGHGPDAQFLEIRQMFLDTP